MKKSGLGKKIFWLEKSPEVVVVAGLVAISSLSNGLSKCRVSPTSSPRCLPQIGRCIWRGGGRFYIDVCFRYYVAAAVIHGCYNGAAFLYNRPASRKASVFACKTVPYH